MNSTATDEAHKARPAALDWEDGVDEPPFKALTREEAAALRARHPAVSPWRVVGCQAVAGVVIVWGWWLFAGWSGKTSNAAWSAFCGAAAVVLPNALMAWGMGRVLRGAPSAAVLGFMFWELIKIMLTIAILAAAAKWMPDLSWPAMLVALIGCLKVNWLVLLWQGRKKRDGH